MKHHKNWKETSFKEFYEEAKRKGALEAIEDPNFGILPILRKEGFSEEQIYEMKMDKVFKLWTEAVMVLFERDMAAIATMLKKKPELFPILAPHLEKMEAIIREAEDEEKKREGQATS